MGHSVFGHDLSEPDIPLLALYAITMYITTRLNPATGVIISLRKDGNDCLPLTGSPGTRSPVTLSQFDPNRTLDQANKPVLFTWPLTVRLKAAASRFACACTVSEPSVTF